jgi:hypothetical protein
LYLDSVAASRCLAISFAPRQRIGPRQRETAARGVLDPMTSSIT